MIPAVRAVPPGRNEALRRAKTLIEVFKRGRRELPLAVGIVAGWLLLIRWGRAFVVTAVPVGPDWNQYFMAAWKVVHRVAEDYPEFRAPFYPWLLGTLGAHVGYVAAAVILSSLGACVVVVAAGLGARALGGPWAGALAAFSVPWVATTTRSARWSSQYAVLAAAGGMALALGACHVRRPRWWLALATGVAAGTVWAVDARGLPFAVAAGGLVVIGSVGRSRWVRAGVSVLLFFGGFLVGPVAQHHLEVIPRRSSSYLVSVQRRMALDDIRAFRTEGIYAPCSQGRPEEVPLPAALFTRCGKALVRHNFHAYGKELPFGMSWTLVLLPLVLLPAGRGWRGVLASALYFFPPVIIMAVVAGIMDVPPRYLVPYAAVFAGIVPVGIARAFWTLASVRGGVWRSRSVVVGMAIAALWLVAMRPREGRPDGPARGGYTQQQQVQGRLIHAVRTRVAEGDRVLDCSHNLRVEVAMLPRVHEPDPAQVRESPDARRCRQWVQQPPGGGGQRWLITGSDPYLAPGASGRWKLEVAVQLPEHQGYLWRWVGDRGARTAPRGGEE